MNPEEVVNWREALIRLSDQHFFDLVRMYLGAIKTPFNKQKIIEELSSFLRKKENRSHIILYLDELDLLILSAIDELPFPTQQKIIKLFSGSYSFPVMYERILNLEERLLVYRKGDSDSREYDLNPLLKDDLLPLLGLSRLIPPEVRTELCYAPSRIDDLSLAALYSFFMHEGKAVKNDGSFRKKTLGLLEVIFSQLYADPDCLPFLLSAFQNLGLLVKQGGHLVPDPVRWQTFALISPSERLAYLVAAAAGRYQRDSLQQRAQIFIDFFAALEPGALYKKDTLTRLAFLISEKSGKSSARRPQGRFASIIRDQEASDGIAPSSGIDYAGIAIAFGLLVENDGLWMVNSSSPNHSTSSAISPYLVVSPSLIVTVMPGFTLADLLPIVSCMEVRDLQIAGQFEITRKSCGVAFDQGSTADSISALFKQRSVQSVPQNVVFSLEDWYRSYSSISLYHGYILQVDEKKRVLFEKNEHLSSLIRKILAPGLYLLNAESHEEVQEMFIRAGMDFLPSISAPQITREQVSLPSLREPLVTESVIGNDVNISNVHEVVKYQTHLLNLLGSMNLEPDLYESLKSRIERKVIMTASQLDPDSVRIEKVEARGIDFLGKVRIAEHAMLSGSMLEIAFDEKEGNRLLLGRPLSTEKRPGDVLLKIMTEPDQVLEQVSLGKAILVRRIRGSIFLEPAPSKKLK